MFGKIVFITAHAELLCLTFQYKIEATDYIIKNIHSSVSLANRIKECIDFAIKCYLNKYCSPKDGFKVKIGNQVQIISFEEIMFFQPYSNPHIIVLYTENGKIEFRGSLKSIEKTSPNLYRCHQSFVVNVKNIKRIDKAKKEIEMVNGQVISVTRKKLKSLIEATYALG